MSKGTMRKPITLASLLNKRLMFADVPVEGIIERAGSIVEARVAILEGRVKVNGTIVLDPKHKLHGDVFDTIEIAYTKWDKRTSTVLWWKRRFVA